MKTIKSGKRKRNILPVFLVSGTLLLSAAGILICFLTNQATKLERYNILTSCETVPVPVFSVPEGIYDQPFKLEIEAPAGHEIYYTTDGSIPTVNSRRYTKPFTIDPRKNPNKNIIAIPTSYIWEPPAGKQNHGTVVRARCFKNGTGYGKTQNVIYSLPTIQQHQGFNVVHILIEADSLFSQDKGIYVLGEKYYSKRAYADNYVNTEVIMANEFKVMQNKLWKFLPGNFIQRGRNWERPAEFILMNTDGKNLFEQNILLRIHGGFTRLYPQKSLCIIPDSIRGDSVFRYPFFDNLPYDSFKRILLRNSGNESTMFRDALVQQIAKNLSLDIQDYLPAVVYINGNYWGIHNIREKEDQNYLSIKYGADLQTINLLENDRIVGVYYGNQESLQSFEKLIEFIKKNLMTDEKSYHHVCNQIDIDNFIEYIIAETFFVNLDWRNFNMRWYQIGNQTETMREKGIEAGKWRWLLFDMDLSMGIKNVSINMFDLLKDNSKFNQIIVPLFLGLLENYEFKEKFLIRYKYVINHFFTTENMLQKIEEFEMLYEPEIERHIARWRQIKSLQVWKQEVENMKEFARKRPQIVLEQLESL